MSGPRFAGYAAIFDRPDRGGDIVRRGAFAGAPRVGLPVFWQHDAGQRIGTVETIEEDKRGLRVVARLDAPRPLAAGHGLSFGYRAVRADFGTYRELNEVELIEISLVTHPMQPLARVHAVQL